LNANTDGLGVESNRRPSPDVESQAARAFVGIRELLLHGEVECGKRLSELHLVSRLGVSRTPIRLALERLAHIGLLEPVATRGFIVRGFTPSEVRDAIEFRGNLEGIAARLAAERLVDWFEIERLEYHCHRMELPEHLTADSLLDVMEANEDFHVALLVLAKSVTLRRAFELANLLPFASVSAMVFPTSLLPKADEILAVAREHHRGIVEAIGKRQGSRAEALAREHALLSRRVFDMAISDRDALGGVPGGSLINLAR
jgi:GntR family transcriptional regulator of vanillate catabolism